MSNEQPSYPPEGADVRHLDISETELRIETREDGEPSKIVGYAAVFGKKSQDLGGFVEVLEPGAFREALPASDVVGLFNHDKNNLLASQRSGRLALEEDDRGLRFEMEPVDTSTARDVMKLIESGDLTGNSFSFRVKEDGDEVDTDQEPRVRRIKPGGIKEVFDVGPVTFPAYRDTVVSTRSVERVKDMEPDNADEDAESQDVPEPVSATETYQRRVRVRERELAT